MIDLAVGVAEERAEPGQILGRRTGYFLVVVVKVAAGDLLRPERDVVIVIEVAAGGGDPVELPSHAALERLKFRPGRPRNGRQRNVAGVEVGRHAREMVGNVRTTGATSGPAGAEHEVVDDQLSAAVEEVVERLLSLWAVKQVGLFDALPGEFQTATIELVALPGEGFFFGQQGLAGGEPFLRRDDGVGGHGNLSTLSREMN